MCGSMSPFRYFFANIKPIVMRDPLAGFLGAYVHHEAMLEYSFDEVVKMTGHACPTVASAFVCCKKALGHLYVGDIPERGNMAVTVHAGADEKAYGVMGQVFSFITGACGEGGFKGIGGKFNRQGLLTYAKGTSKEDAGSFTFARLDNGKKVKARIVPEKFPVVQGQEELPGLMEKALKDTATHDEVHRFQDLWMERVKAIAMEERDVDAWLIIKT